jgi:hypothetical protein
MDGAVPTLAHRSLEQRLDRPPLDTVDLKPVQFDEAVPESDRCLAPVPGTDPARPGVSFTASTGLPNAGLSPTRPP